ncbi:MAG TPA: glycosyltransferase [Desulfonatronum sp.]|nr:glycosyltransferase [Desulfonatronum sp.]
MKTHLHIDFLACERHNFSHLKPIWDYLPSEHRGVFYILSQLDRKEDFIGLDEIESLRVFESTNELTESLNGGKGLLVTSTFYDQFLPEICRPLVFVAHGGGQTFNGQPLHLFARKNYVLDIVPNEHMAQVFQQRYPYTQKHVVGSPKLDKWHIGFKMPENKKPVIAISFHFDRQTVPETRTSWPHFKSTLPLLARQNKWKILGHGHPRMIDTLIPHYEKLGIEIVKDFDEVMQRADLYICDHMATLYEFASTNRPVVVLNAPWYRRDVEHGLRFWEHADVGINCDHPHDLIMAVESALEDPLDQQIKRKNAVHGVYPFTDGKATERAVQAIMDYSRIIKSKDTLFLYPGTAEHDVNDFLKNCTVTKSILNSRSHYHRNEILKSLKASDDTHQNLSLSDLEYHYWALALLLRKNGKQDEAVKIYNDYKRLNTKSKYMWILERLLPTSQTAFTSSPATLYKKGIKYLKSNKFDESLKIFDHIVDRVDPLHFPTIAILRALEEQLPPNWLKARENLFLERYKNSKTQKIMLQACQFNNSQKIMNFIYNEIMKTNIELMDPGQNPMVSIIIPCYNGEQTIHKTVQSVSKQTYNNYELIIVDDSSTDDSWNEIEVIKSYFNNDIVTRRLESNKGVSRARNIGAELSKGDFLLFLDCGDEIAPTYLEKMIEAASCHPEFSWYYPVTLQKESVNRFWSFEEFSEINNLSRNTQPVTSLMRKSLFTALDGFSEQFREGYEDWDFWIRAIKKGYKGKLVRHILFIYNKAIESRNHQLQADNTKEYRAKLKIIENSPELYKPLTSESHAVLRSNLRISPELVKESALSIIKKRSLTFETSNSNTRIMLYFLKNVHIPILKPIYQSLKKLLPKAKIAFGYHEYAPQIRAGFSREELELLCSYGEDMYLKPQEFKPDVTFIADSVYPWVQGCGKLVHIGHGVLSKGQYYTMTETALREEQADLVCVPGKHHQQIMRRIISKPVMATGMAKLDPLFSGQITRESMLKMFGLPHNKKYILFAPTFNDELSAIPYFQENISNVIPNKDCFLLIKLHGSTKQEYKDMYKRLPAKDPRIVYVDELDISPYLALADVLVSDVSSAMMEFAALDKPVVLFNNPDWEKYANYNPDDIEFKWRDIGIETTNIEEMREAVAACLENPEFKSDKRKKYTDLLFANKYDGKAAERIVKMAMGMFVNV